MENLKTAVETNSSEVQQSTATVLTIVSILKQIARISQNGIINEATMMVSLIWSWFYIKVFIIKWF